MSLKKTNRTKVNRAPKRACYDRDLLNKIIDEALVGHLAFKDSESIHSIPLLFWRVNDELYSHCSVNSRLTKLCAEKNDVSISFSILDGLVLAKSAFKHSANYRSAVIYGKFQQVTAEQEMLIALKAFMDLVKQDRWHAVRQPNKRELNATHIFKIPLEEAVVKVRSGPPVDSAKDLTREVWAGVIPCEHLFGKPIEHKHSQDD